MDSLDSNEVERRKAANVRTALAFASIAATFFVGIIAARILGGPVVGIGLMSVAVLLFLVFAIGRSLRMSEGRDSRGRPGEQGGAEAAAKGACPSDCSGRPPLGPFDPPLAVRRPRQ